MDTSKHILVVDDEADIVELVSYNLKKEGFGVDSALNGETALRKIRKGKYDLVVLDLMLPGIQGMELCRILRNDPKTEALPLIMLTAKGEERYSIGNSSSMLYGVTKPLSSLGQLMFILEG